MRKTWLLGLVVLAACESPWAIELEQPLIDPPEEYARWYQEVAACMGLSQEATAARFERIQWYSASEIYNDSDGIHAVGLWTEPHRITLRADRLLDSNVVKHELIHDFLSSGEHASPHFNVCASPDPEAASRLPLFATDNYP